MRFPFEIHLVAKSGGPPVWMAARPTLTKSSCRYVRADMIAEILSRELAGPSNNQAFSAAFNDELLKFLDNAMHLEGQVQADMSNQEGVSSEKA